MSANNLNAARNTQGNAYLVFGSHSFFDSGAKLRVAESHNHLDNVNSTKTFLGHASLHKARWTFISEGDFPTFLHPSSFAPLHVYFWCLLSPDVWSYLLPIFFAPAVINGGVCPRGCRAGVQLRARCGRKCIPSWNGMRSARPDTIHIQKTWQKWIRLLSWH